MTLRHVLLECGSVILLALAPAPLAAQQPPQQQHPEPRVPGPVPPPGQVQPRPGVLVAPTRLVFDNRRRTAEVNLTNTGNVPGDYRVYLVRMEMDADGGIREVPLEPALGQVAARDLIRFAPKIVSLKPQESQAVRVQLRKPADLPDGEYRVFMVFRDEPPPPPEPAAGDPANPPKGISVQITTLFGVAIPVLIRQGPTSAKVAITGLTLAPDGKRLDFVLERTGNQSVHGDLKASFLPRAGKPRTLGEINGLSVFSPNPLRKVAMALEGAAPAGPGRIQLAYTSAEEPSGELLAERSLDLP